MIGIETTAAVTVYTLFSLLFFTTTTTTHYTARSIPHVLHYYYYSFFFYGIVRARVCTRTVMRVCLCVVLKKMVFIWKEIGGEGERERVNEGRWEERVEERERTTRA